MKIIFLIISCIISCELTFRLRFEKNFYSIKENIKNYLRQIKNLSDANNDDPFKILIKLFIDYLKIVTKFVLILLPDA